jgi:hypothetical protein
MDFQDVDSLFNWYIRSRKRKVPQWPLTFPREAFIAARQVLSPIRSSRRRLRVLDLSDFSNKSRYLPDFWQSYPHTTSPWCNSSSSCPQWTKNPYFLLYPVQRYTNRQTRVCEPVSEENLSKYFVRAYTKSVLSQSKCARLEGGAASMDRTASSAKSSFLNIILARHEDLPP